jgi:hypothetical protein
MGTSKAYGGIKGSPTWGPLSNTVSRAVNDGHPTRHALGSVMSHTVSHLGGSHGASSGGSSTGGRSGVRTAQRLGSFIGSIQNDGFQNALNFIAGGQEIEDANQAINVILEKCADNAGTQDEVAAKAAMRDLLEEIGAKADTLEELGEDFEKAIKDYGAEELLVKYFGYYLYEHLCTDFYEKLIKEKGIRETEGFYKDLKDYILEKTKTTSKHRDLRKVDWNTDYGKGLMQEIFRDTLKAFEDYEG